MIYPTAPEILRCINQALLDAMDETLPRMAVKSALATTRHLIRHVELRFQFERQILLDDISKAEQLLDNLAAYLDVDGSDRGGRGGIARAIRTALAEAPQLLSRADDEIETIRLRAKTLRELVYSALTQLQSAGTEERSSTSYRATRRLLREYMAYQIQQESRLIYPAFAGKGPRR